MYKPLQHVFQYWMLLCIDNMQLAHHLFSPLFVTYRDQQAHTLYNSPTLTRPTHNNRHTRKHTQTRVIPQQLQLAPVDTTQQTHTQHLACQCMKPDTKGRAKDSHQDTIMVFKCRACLRSSPTGQMSKLSICMIIDGWLSLAVQRYCFVVVVSTKLNVSQHEKPDCI